MSTLLNTWCFIQKPNEDSEKARKRENERERVKEMGRVGHLLWNALNKELDAYQAFEYHRYNCSWVKTIYFRTQIAIWALVNDSINEWAVSSEHTITIPFIFHTPIQTHSHIRPHIQPIQIKTPVQITWNTIEYICSTKTNTNCHYICILCSSSSSSI